MDGKTGFVAYESRFWFPSEESRSYSPFYYSYETGPIHIVMLGCYVDYLKHSEQASWLRRDLASVDRERTPWLVVGMHVSIKPSTESYNRCLGALITVNKSPAKVHDIIRSLKSVLQQ